MTEKDFLSNLEELLELDSGAIAIETKLVDLPQWDSLAALVFMAMADAKFGVNIPASGLRGCQTVADLMKLVDKQ